MVAPEVSTSTSSEERLLAFLIYASVYSICVLTLPIVAYIMCAKNSYVRQHARRALTLQVAALVGPAAGYGLSLAGANSAGTLVGLGTYAVAIALMFALGIAALLGRY